MRALILGAGLGLAALGAVRALGQAGWEVGVGSPKRRGFASASRYTKNWHQIPSPVDGMNAFIDAVNHAIAEENYDIVFGAGDAELLALAYAKDQIASTIPYPAYPNVQRALDKLSLAEVAFSVGVGTPATFEATEEALGHCNWPVVLKPRFHWLPGNTGGPSRLEAEILSNKADAVRRADEIRTCGGVPLAQEFIAGDLMGYTVVTNTDHKVVARLQQMAPLTWYPDKGMPARAHTVPVDQDLAKLVEDLLAELRWFGLVQLQFILPPDKVPKLIDFNGRTYASLALATAAGVNFMDIWGRLACGQSVAPTIEAPPGIRYHWLEGDLKRSLFQRQGGLLNDIVSCFRYAPGSVGPVWSIEDPGPGTRFPLYLFDKLA